jgi:hypothetical protein
MTKPQVAAPLRQGPWAMSYRGRGFESHLSSPRVRARDARTECSWRPDRPRQRPSWVWFEQAGCWGTNLPLTRDSPPIQGDVPGPDPARAPPNKAIARAGLACRGQSAGVSLASQGPPGGAPLPRRAGRLWSMFGPHPMGADRYAAVTGGRSFRRSLVPSWESGPVKSADKERSAGSNAPPVSDTVGGSRSNCEPARVA